MCCTEVFMDQSLPLFVLFVFCLRNPFLSQSHKGIPLWLFLAGIYFWVVWGEVRIWLFPKSILVAPLTEMPTLSHPSVTLLFARTSSHTCLGLSRFHCWVGLSPGPTSNCHDHPSFMGSFVLWQNTLPSLSFLLRVVAGTLGAYLLFHVNFRIRLCDLISHIKPCWHVN